MAIFNSSKPVDAEHLKDLYLRVDALQGTRLLRQIGQSDFDESAIANLHSAGIDIKQTEKTVEEQVVAAKMIAAFDQALEIQFANFATKPTEVFLDDNYRDFLERWRQRFDNSIGEQFLINFLSAKITAAPDQAHKLFYKASSDMIQLSLTYSLLPPNYNFLTAAEQRACNQDWSAYIKSLPTKLLADLLKHNRELEGSVLDLLIKLRKQGGDYEELVLAMLGYHSIDREYYPNTQVLTMLAGLDNFDKPEYLDLAAKALANSAVRLYTSSDGSYPPAAGVATFSQRYKTMIEFESKLPAAVFDRALDLIFTGAEFDLRAKVCFLRHLAQCQDLYKLESEGLQLNSTARSRLIQVSKKILTACPDPKVSPPGLVLDAVLFLSYLDEHEAIITAIQDELAVNDGESIILDIACSNRAIKDSKTFRLQLLDRLPNILRKLQESKEAYAHDLAKIPPMESFYRAQSSPVDIFTGEGVDKLIPLIIAVNRGSYSETFDSNAIEIIAASKHLGVAFERVDEDPDLAGFFFMLDVLYGDDTPAAQEGINPRYRAL